MIATRQTDEAQARKAAEVVRLLERLIDDVQQGVEFSLSSYSQEAIR